MSLSNNASRFFVISLFMLLGALPLFSRAAGGGIVPAHPYAWSERVGWMNFGTTEGDVQVTDNQMTGHVWNENTGWINLAPTSSTYVTNDGQGNLSGYAWGEGVGYIDFSGITIDSQGFFHGYANSTLTGQISFNCANASSCGLSDFKVQTYWQAPTTTSTSTTSTPGGGGGRRSTPPPSIAPREIIVELPSAQIAAPIASRIPLVVAGQRIPKYLFDISLAVDPNILAKSEDLSARVSFTNFGTDSTWISMLFSIVDSQGKTLYTDRATTTVQTQKIFNQSFNELMIGPGNYTLVLDTFYGTSTRDKLSQKFMIIGDAETCSLWRPLPWLVAHITFLAWFGCRLPWYLLLMAIAITLFAIWRHRRRVILRRRKSFELEEYTE